MREWTAPELKRAVSWQISRAGAEPSTFYVTAEYVDEQLRKCAAWRATYLRVRVFFMYTGTPLEPVEMALRTFPELERLEQFWNTMTFFTDMKESERPTLDPHNRSWRNLRTQVIALVQKERAEQP